MATESTSRPHGSRLLRILFLAVLVAVVNAWARRHLDMDWLGLALVNGALGFVGVFAALLGGLEEDRLAGVKRDLLRRVLRWPVLITLLVLTVTVCSFVSSVTVLAGGADDAAAVRLAPEGDAAPDSVGVLAGRGSLLRRYVFTTPFGRPFYLEVDGYVRHSFDLYPWTGATIRVDRDLVRLPTIVVRTHYQDHQQLKRGALVIAVAGGGRIEVPTDEDRGAVILGRRVPIPAPLVAEWRSELLADSVTGALAEKHIRKWKNPENEVVGYDRLPIRPGDRLDVSFVVDQGVVASTSCRITTSPLQDVRLAKGP